MVAGDSKIVLAGANIDFITPGTFTVKSAGHAWGAGANGSVEQARLPDSRVQLHDEAFELKDPVGEPLVGIPFKTATPAGYEFGQTEERGRTHRVSTESSQFIEFEPRWFELE